MTDSIKEPDWKILSTFGMPINIVEKGKPEISYGEVFLNIISASQILTENRSNKDYNRHYDAFKAMLLALKIHYPSKYFEIENKTGSDLNDLFDLNNISGRDIKLQRISLSQISDFFKTSP
ncbi:MAG: hypothetical protein CVV49_18315 [Spirochaetae bacterium HGW-Spirochaetae-5]|nr:MAG: hypothetical protein CVV49_18315 [Spirochaetae bacterium HGW-Spirochaetae-5]